MYENFLGVAVFAGSMSSRTFATVESVAFGSRQGLRFPSLMLLTPGLTIALLLWQAARGFHAPPGAGPT
jgi:hypothetical protein